VDDYISGLEPPRPAALERIAAVVVRAAPQAEQATCYGLPAFRVRGRPLLGLRASASHLAISSFSSAVVEAVADGLDGWDISKGTIRFTGDRPIPDEVVDRIVALRLAELGCRAAEPGAGPPGGQPRSMSSMR